MFFNVLTHRSVYVLKKQVYKSIMDKKQEYEGMMNRSQKYNSTIGKSQF